MCALGQVKMTDSPPKTRKEKKKNQKVKADGLNGKYSAKHARQNLFSVAAHNLNK
jgi:hypothetical protein